MGLAVCYRLLVVLVLISGQSVAPGSYQTGM